MRGQIQKATRRKYVVISLVVIAIHPVNVQFAMPMGMIGPPPFPPPPPQMFAVAAPPQSQSQSMFALPPPPMQIAFLPPPPVTAAPRNDNVAIAIPVPMEMPMQIAVPASPPTYCTAQPSLPGCPPCPPCICTPSCTPAFFSYCSPCHQQCRCKDRSHVPKPLPPIAPMPAPGPAFPMPMPMAPPSVLMVPMPPMMPRHSHRHPHNSRYESSSRESSSSDDDTSVSSSSSEHRRSGLRLGSRSRSRLRPGSRSRSRHHGDERIYRKFNRRRTVSLLRRDRDDDDTIIKPVLSFVNRRGDVKINKQLNSYDVAALIGDNSNNLVQERIQRRPNRVQNVRVLTDDDDDKKGQVLVISEFNDKDSNVRRTEPKNSDNQRSERKLRSGSKQLIFKPPENKKISNFSVSFQVV